MSRGRKTGAARKRAASLACLALAFLFAGFTAAQEPEASAGDRSSLQGAVERLRQLVDGLRPHVEAAETREQAPTAAEIAEAEVYVRQINDAIRDVESLIESIGSTETPSELRAARKLLRRIAALDLNRRAAELRDMVNELGSREEPPSDEEIRELRRLAADLQTSMNEFESESSELQPSKKSVRDAEKAVALSKSADVFVEAEQSREVLEEVESDPTEVTEEGARAARIAAGELQSSIDQVRRDAGIKKGDDEPAGLKRARRIVIRLQILALAGTTAKLWPEVERLSELAAPPSTEELDALRPLIDRLVDALDALESNLKIDGTEESPPEAVAAIDVYRRFARLDLRRSLTDMRPTVDAAAQQNEALTPEQISELRQIPKVLRPKIRAARRTSKQDSEVADDSAAPEVVEANKLLAQVQDLVPEAAAVTEEPVDAPDTQPVTRFFRFYGSVRVRALVTSGRNGTVDGQTSRIGVRIEGKERIKSVKGFARGEVGFNFLEATEEIYRGLDEGRGILEESLFFGRLYYIGADVSDKRISFGKQWSAFYDVGVFSDQMPFFAGEGTGVYAAGTDGGLSGTGRADGALQFRDAIGIFKYTAQIQIRNVSDNNRLVADTVGGSVTWKRNDRMQIGGAFNVVRDGVPDPSGDQPREGDRAFILGYRYQEEEVYAGATVTLFNNHDRDNLGNYFGGIGFEWYGGYQWSERLLLRLAISSLNPDSDYQGSYRVLSFTSGASYDLTKRVRLLLLTRYDRSKRADASDRNHDVVSLSVFYNF